MCRYFSASAFRFGGNFFLADLFAVCAVEVVGLHRDQVDHALEVVFFADRVLHQHCVALQLLADHIHDTEWIRAHAVHLVDERQSRHVIALHLPIDGHRLRLHTANRAEDQHRAVEDPQATLHFDRKVDVPGRIDQVDRVLLPRNRRGRTGDCDAFLALQVHIIHGRAGAVPFDFLHAVNAARVKEDPLAQGGLARVDMGRNADISYVR